jgi:hypothetical protein
MKIIQKISAFLSLSREVKILFFKAYFLSGLVKLTLIFLPFRKVLSWQGKINTSSSLNEDQATAVFRKSLQQAMILCNKYTLWETECYTQAITAKILLNRKDIEGTIYIGFKKDQSGKYLGHAWLRSFDRIITGNTDINSYSVHGFYS